MITWVTLKTTSVRWEAELMQQVLAAHDIPSRIVDLGIPSYFGAGSPAALQVLASDCWTALFLLSSPEEESREASDNK